MDNTLKKNMVGALSWSAVNIFGVQLLQLIIGIILARLLTPADFGIVGVLFIFISLSTVLIDSGFGQGLIRKKDADQTDFSTIFYFNLAISIVLYLILYFATPLIALFFKQPALIDYARILFIVILIFPFYFIQSTQLLKKLQYKAIAIVNIISVTISGSIAAILAFKDFGVWALVVQQLSFHAMRFITYSLYTTWRPALQFSKKTIQSLWRFTLPILGQSSLNAVFNQIYTIIIGRFYPIQQVGYFTQANKYSETVNYAAQSILSTGTFPVLSTIQDDKIKLLSVYRRLIASVALLTFPFVIFLVVAAEPIIITLITDKWLPSVIFLQLLLLANLFSPMFTININMLNAQGQSALSLKLELIKKSLIIISILICFSFGIKIMLMGFVLANFVAYAISMMSIKKSLNHYYRHQIKDLFGKIFSASIAGIGIWFLNYIDMHLIVKLMLQGIIFLGIYTATLWLCFRESREILIGLLKRIV